MMLVNIYLVFLCLIFIPITSVIYTAYSIDYFIDYFINYFNSYKEYSSSKEAIRDKLSLSLVLKFQFIARGPPIYRSR